MSRTTPPSPGPEDDAAWLEPVRQALALPDAPAAWIQRAVELWPRHRPTPLSLQTLVQRCRAVLAFDSWGLQPQAAGLRSVPSPVRHLVFQARGLDVDLRLAPAADGQAWELHGQLLGSWLGTDTEAPGQGLPDAGPAPTLDEALVELQRADDDTAPLPSRALDDSGEFGWTGLPAGEYRLWVRMPGAELELPVIACRPKSPGPAPSSSAPQALPDTPPAGPGPEGPVAGR